MTICAVLWFGFMLMKGSFDSVNSATPDDLKNHSKSFTQSGRVGSFIFGLIFLFIAWLLVQIFTSPPFYG